MPKLAHYFVLNNGLKEIFVGKDIPKPPNLAIRFAFWPINRICWLSKLKERGNWWKSSLRLWYWKALLMKGQVEFGDPQGIWYCLYCHSLFMLIWLGISCEGAYKLFRIPMFLRAFPMNHIVQKALEGYWFLFFLSLCQSQ